MGFVMPRERKERWVCAVIPTSQNPNSLLFCPSLTVKKLQSLASEFKALPEPIDRVKRLLIYASQIPPLDESDRLESNRVMGCTTQVWLEVKMDSKGLMRFRADSDAEITKGFCSCLIWVLLDGQGANASCSCFISGAFCSAVARSN